MKSKLTRRFLAFFLGCISLLLIIEFIMAFSARIAFPKITSQIVDEKKFRIVFLGNSHTDGAGIPEGKAYTNLLHSFFDDEGVGEHVQIFKRGYGNANTHVLNNKLDFILPELKPDLVILMGGEANRWNYFGIEEYFFFKKFTTNSPTPSTIYSKIEEYSRFYRWLIYLYRINHIAGSNSKKDEKNPIIEQMSLKQINDKKAYSLIAHVHNPYHILNPSSNQLNTVPLRKISEFKEILEKFIKDNKKFKLTNLKTFLYLLARIESDYFFNFYKSYDYLNQIVELDDKFHYFSYNFLKRFEYDSELYSASTKIKFLKLFDKYKSKIKVPTSKELEYYDHILKYQYPPPISRGEQINFLEKVWKSHNDSIRVALPLSELHFEEKNYYRAVQVLGELFDTNPMSLQFTGHKNFYNIGNNENIKDQKAKDLIKEIMVKISKRFPNEPNLNLLTKNDVNNWIQWDIEKILKKVKFNNSKLVLQNYHWLRFNDEFSPNSAIKKIATETATPFIDTYTPFVKELNLSKKEIGDFYTPFYGPIDSHPSELGHQLIARIIYDYLNENELLPQKLLNLDAKKIYKFSWE